MTISNINMLAKVLEDFSNVLLDTGLELNTTGNSKMGPIINYLLKLEKNEIEGEIPLDVLRFIDDGKNPDIFTEEMQNVLKDCNKMSREKIKSLEILKKCIEEQ